MLSEATRGREPSERVAGGLVPTPYVVAGRRVETDDIVTLSLTPPEGVAPAFAHGQFNMVTAFGRGEIALSMSNEPDAEGLEHTIRRVGAVSAALCDTPVGGVVGVRGPFGTSWGLDGIEDGADVVVMAGGIGLAPLRGAVRGLVRRQQGGRGRVFVLVGARSPEQVLYGDDLEEWRGAGIHVGISVDVGAPGWTGTVGVVTVLLESLPLEVEGACAMLCGPEVMMRFAGRALADRGIDPGGILVSLERNMQCGLGWCGHCQLGPLLVCRDGPIVPYGGMAEPLLMQRNR
jgi:NAD(P)H-flavin reductase